MGTEFFNRASNGIIASVNPLAAIGNGLVSNAGTNSWLAKTNAGMPLADSQAAKVMDPSVYNASQQYNAANAVPNLPDPAFRGVAPSLGDSLTGYQKPTAQTPQAPPPRVTSPPIVPRMQAQGYQSYGY